MGKNFFDQFDEATTPSKGANFFDQFDESPVATNRSTRDAADKTAWENGGRAAFKIDEVALKSGRKALDYELQTEEQVSYDPVTGAAISSFDAPRAGARSNKEIDRLNAIERKADELSLINSVPRDRLVALATDMVDQPKKPVEEKSRVQGFLDKGYDLPNAQRNAGFEAKLEREKLNRTALNAAPDETTGRRALQRYDSNEESKRVEEETASLAKAREDAIYRQGMDRITAKANESPNGYALGSGLIQAATGLSNAPQALLNAGVEAAEYVSGSTLPKIPKWSFTKEAMDVAGAAVPDVAKKEVAQAYRDGDFGAMVFANIAQSAPSTAMSMAAMFVPPLRAAVLPMMGATSAGQSYSSGDSAIGSVLKGGIEVATEMLPLGAFDKARKAVNALPLPDRAAVASVVARKMMQVGGEVSAVAATNFIEEAVAQIGGNVVDRYVEGKKTDVADGVLKAGIIGAASGAMLAGPSTAQRLTEPGSKQEALEREFSRQLDESQFGDLPGLATTNPNLTAQPSVTSFADPNGPASKAGITPIVVPTPQNVSTPSNTGGLAAGAGTGGSPVGIPSVGDMGPVDAVGRGLGDVAGASKPAGSGNPSVLLSSGEPSASVNPVKRTADADLLSRVAYEEEAAPAANATNATPDSIWTGRSGAGYDTVESAQQALESRVKKDPELQWKVEQRPDGKYHLAGYSTGDINGQAGNQAASVRNSNDLENSGAVTGDSKGAAIAGGLAGVADTASGAVSPSIKQVVGDSAAARAKAQASLDYWHGREPNTHPKVTLGEPDAKADAQIQSAMQQAKELFGVSADVIAFSDPNPDSINGMEMGGRVYVNTKGLSSNALNTGWHETHHVMQAYAEADTKNGKTGTPAQRYIAKVDAIFDTMGEAGKREYIESFLYKDRLAGLTGAKREAAIQKALASKETRREMMADFVGNRATDRGFIRSLAKADPKNFQQWAKKWLQTINDLIAELRGNSGSKQSKAVDRYVADLNKARMIVRDAMVELRNSGQTELAGDSEADAQYQRKGVVGEVAPFPAEKDQKVVAEMTPEQRIKNDERAQTESEWNETTDSEKTTATRSVYRKQVDRVMSDMGLRGWSVDFSSGTFEGKENPNFIITAPDTATSEQITELANAIGYVLDQKAMITFDESNTTEGYQASFVKVALPSDMNSDTVKQLRNWIAEKAPVAGGDTLRDGTLVYGNFSGVSDAEFESAINAAVESFAGYDGTGQASVSDVLKWQSGHIEPGTRDEYLKGTRYESSESEVATGGDSVRGTTRDRRAWIEGVGRDAIAARDEWVRSSVSGRARAGVQQRALAEATQSTAKAEREYGVAREGSVAKVAVHFSQQRRKLLSSEFHGSGLKGAERERAQSKDYIKDRLFFYVDNGKGVTPEAGVGGVRHIVKLKNLYDVSKDPKGFGRMSTGATEQERQTKFENFVKNAGFDGYFMDKGANQDFAVLIGKHAIEMPSYSRRFKSVDEFDSEPQDFDRMNELGSFNVDTNDAVDDFAFPDLSGADKKLDKQAELQAELDREFRQRMVDKAKMKAGPSAVTLEKMQEAGLNPESVFSLGEMTERDGTIDFSGASGYPEAGNMYEVREYPSGWRVGTEHSFTMGNNWTKDGAIRQFRNLVTAPFIHKAGFDIAAHYRKGTALKLAQTWRNLAGKNGTFKLPARSSKMEFAEVAKEIGAIGDYDIEVNGNRRKELTFTSKSGATSFNASIAMQDDKTFKCCTMGLDGSKIGSEFYAVASEWARNNKLSFAADATLSAVNGFRRTEQATSYALKTGDTGVILPGVQNRVYGYNENPVTKEDHDMNLARLLIAGMRNAMEVDPEIRRLRYTPETGKFTDSRGNDAEATVKAFLANKDARASGMGRSTLARAVLTSQIIAGGFDAGAVTKFAEPVAYSRKMGVDSALSESYAVRDNGVLRRDSEAADNVAEYNGDGDISFARKQGPSERKYQENYLVPEVDGEFADDSGNIAVMPGLVFAKDGITRNYKSMPVRVRVGEHVRDTSEKLTSQYGLQHRIENKQKDSQRRGYVTPKVDGEGTAPEVEQAMRDIALGIYEGATVYADNDARKVYLHAPSIDRMTVLERRSDSTGKDFWNVVTSMPQTRADMMRRYKAPTTVGGITYNGERTQQAFDIKRGILNKLKEPGTSPVTSESYILDDDGLLFNQPVAETPKAETPVRVLARDANGKIILNKRKVEPVSMSRKQSTGLPEETKLQSVQRVMQDQYNRVKLVQDLLVESGGLVGEEQDVYRAEERMHGRVHELMRQFKDDVVQPFLDKAVAEKVDLNELALYAYAKHAKERNAHIQTFNKNVKTGSGMSDDTADNIIQLVDLSGDRAKFDDLHNDMMAMTATTRRVMLDEGLITQNQYNGLESMYQHYVPLRGFEDVEAETGKVRPGLGRGFNVKGKETIAAMGRDSMAGDIIENIIRDYERVTIRAEKNAVGKTFLDLVQNNPDPNLWEVQPIKRAARKDANGLVQYVNVEDKGEDTVAVKVAGESVYIKVHDDLFLRAMQNTFKGEKSDSERFVLRVAGMYTSLLRNTITRFNPVFGVINAVRDSQMGAMGVFDELGAEGLKLYAKHYAGALAAGARTEVNKSDPQKYQMDRWMREMRFAGGTTGGVFMRDNETIRSELRDAMLAAGIAPNGVLDWAKHNTGVRAAKHVLHALEVIGAVSEHAARLSAYTTAREMGRTPAQAASIAKNLTVNFNRFGEQGQLINTLFLFYNAAVQGSVRIGQMAKNPKVQAAFAGMAGVGLSLAFWAAAVGGDDEDGQPYWDKIPDWEKERNLIIMLAPGFDSGAKVGKHGRYIKIPMAYGLNVFPVLGYQMADVMRNIKDPTKGSSAGKAAINMVSAVMGSYNPFGGSLSAKPDATWALAVAPTVADPIIQLSQGVDGFGKPTGPSKSQFDKRPDSEIVSGAQHGKVYHRIARYLNEATGGNQAREGGIDLQPGTIKNIGGIVGGGLGKFVGDMLNLGYLGVQDLPIETRDIPVYKAFYGEYDKKAGMSRYYERSEKAMTEFASMKNEMKLGVKRGEYSDEEKFLQMMGAQAEDMSKAMGELKKWEVSIAESEGTDKEKEIKRKEVQKVRERLAADYNKDWYREESKLKTEKK